MVGAAKWIERQGIKKVRRSAYLVEDFLTPTTRYLTEEVQ
jgi:hypothetical protein